MVQPSRLLGRAASYRPAGSAPAQRRPTVAGPRCVAAGWKPVATQVSPCLPVTPGSGLFASAFPDLTGPPKVTACSADMTIRDIQERLTGPFVPFKLRTSDGAEFPVPHREFIFLTSKRVVVANAEGYVNILDPSHIVSIEEARSLPAS